MCGRFTLFADEDIKEINKIIKQVEAKNKNIKTGEIYPTNTVPVLLFNNNTIEADTAKWGFNGFKGNNVIINARSETVKEKRMFKSCVESRRCVIPSTGFYEWKKDKNKTKYLFNVPDTKVLYMAGIYNMFENERKFVILTTGANDSMAEIHNRMPLILKSDMIEDWIKDDKAVDFILNYKEPVLKKQSIDSEQQLSLL